MNDRTPQRPLKSGDLQAGAAIARAVKSRAGKRRQTVQPPTQSVVTRSSAYAEPLAREAMIAEAAYFRSAHRGFEPGHEVDDWLAAESEIDMALARGDLPNYCG
jgi:hypothetical protein